MTDIFSYALQGDNTILQKFEAMCKSSDSSATFNDLSTTVRTSGRLSINMRPHVAASLLTKGQYFTIYQVAQNHAKVSGRSVEIELQRLLGNFYKKRQAFDSALTIPRTAFYAALNLGGLGAPCYGSFCVVISGLAVTKNKIAFVKADSLNNYVQDDGTVNVEGILQDICSNAQVGALVCLKHADDPLLIDPLSWPQMACNETTYIEAVIDEALSSDQVSEIRMKKKEYDDLMNLALGGIYRKPNGDAERALAQDFLDIISAAQSASVRIEILES